MLHTTIPEISETTLDWTPRTRLIFGTGKMMLVGECARAAGARSVLLVTDKGIVSAGHVARAVKSLKNAGLSVVVDDEVRENPTTADVARCVEIAREEKIDFIVGLGGGSSMDTAKGCNFILTNGGEIKDYWGVGKATKPMLPLIAIPTTAGTGSECQSAALIADEQTHQKMACLDLKAAALIAILDPELTLSQPARVAACTGVDAIVHAVESMVTRKANPVSMMLACEAFRFCMDALPRILEMPGDIEARGRMQLGAAFAGMAIEASMLGAAHSAANPLTAHYGITHGQAVGLMLPEIIRFNAEEPSTAEGYARLCDAASLSNTEALSAKITALVERAGLSARLSDFGVQQSQISLLAEEAARQWTASFNPKKITAKDFEALYENVF